MWLLAGLLVATLVRLGWRCGAAFAWKSSDPGGNQDLNPLTPPRWRALFGRGAKSLDGRRAGREAATLRMIQARGPKVLGQLPVVTRLHSCGNLLDRPIVLTARRIVACSRPGTWLFEESSCHES